MRLTSVSRALVVAIVGALLLSSLACFGGSKRARRYQKAELQEALGRLETPGLVIGEFTLAKNAVVDGDTIKVAGLDSSLRLCNLDTEETFKNEADRRLFESGWENYLSTKQGQSSRPIKAATPMGEAAKEFAKKFFEGVDVVRLERDHPKEIRDRYNRYLAYVFARKNGEWVNYNVEAVRAGMSPYFTKYGYSRRFHDLFAQAQREAQQKELGIWNPNTLHYRDYVQRLEWWDARADFLMEFETEAAGKENYIDLSHWDAMRRLEKYEGREVVVFGAIEEIILGDKGPTRVKLSRRMGGAFPLIFFDKDVFGSSHIARYAGEYVRVKGTVTRYRSRFGREELQIVVNFPGQVRGSDKVPNFTGVNPEGTGRGNDDGEDVEAPPAEEKKEEANAP